MSMKCPSCGAVQPDDARTCSACGTELPARPGAKPPAASMSSQEIMMYSRYALRYTLMPVLLVTAVVCAAWLICSNFIR